ncbi:MAG: efflux RND transporter periplasmic adaptor subunit [Bryobacterales bacterium]|jgi:RND family efflux transporter MFP subunit|nr:efflux RND transporter periplasmic adaptor subunit [Bryobacterales bacterium]
MSAFEGKKLFGLSGAQAMLLVASILVVGFGAAAWLASASAATAAPDAGSEALPVESLRLQQVDTLEVVTRYSGAVEAGRSAQLAFERPGRIVQVLVKEGEWVATGQVLAQLDLAELDVQRLQAESQLAQAEALEREFTAGPRRELVAGARAQVNEAQEQLRLLELQLQRRQDLLRREAISREEFDTFATQVSAQAARVELVRQRLGELEAGTRVEQLDGQRAAVSLARARVQELRILIGKSSLRAPFPGRIARRNLDEGAYVNPGTAVLELLESNALEIRVGLPAEQLAAARAGQDYPILIQGQRYPARLQRVLPELDAVTRIVPVLLDVPVGARDAALPGMLAHLELPRTLKGPGYRVPLAALTRADRGLWACFAIVEGDAPGAPRRVERREVEILHSDGDFAYVRGLIAEGEQIVAGGVNRVTDGQRVVVVKES